MRGARRLAIAGLAAAIAVAAAGAARPAHAQPAHLAPGDVPSGAASGAIESEPPAIELLTFGVGARIFEKFGHAALCLRYHQPEHPAVCFNYGVTDFNAGGELVWNFLRGKQRFWVEPTSLDSMLQFYEWEDRDIWRQRLPITGDAARALEARLWHDIRPENRYYYYDHFRDNCTTRLRDMIDDATHGRLRAGTDAPYPRTFRELGRHGLAGMPLLLVLTDLITGRELDEHPTIWQAMFHPEIFRGEIATQLGAIPELVYHRRGTPFPIRGETGRLHFLAFAVAFALPLFIAQTRRRGERASLIAVTVWLTLIGALVWGVAIVSTIPALRYNEALLVVVPLDAALPFLPTRWQRRYARIRLGVLGVVMLLALSGVFQQPLWIVILAVVLPMATIAFDLPHGTAARRA